MHARWNFVCFSRAFHSVATLLVLAVVTLGFASTSQAAVLFVDASATGASDGTNWADAHTDLQDALAAAISGDDIWVAVGTYKPATGADRTISFVMKEGVDLYGGFAGNEDPVTFDLADRDIAGKRSRRGRTGHRDHRPVPPGRIHRTVDSSAVSSPARRRCRRTSRTRPRG